jgi:hypothetical protein
MSSLTNTEEEVPMQIYTEDEEEEEKESAPVPALPAAAAAAASASESAAPALTVETTEEQNDPRHILGKQHNPNMLPFLLLDGRSLRSFLFSLTAVSQLNLSFSEAFSKWLSVVKKRELLRDDEYEEIVRTLRDGMMAHKRYWHWSERKKYLVRALNGKVALYQKHQVHDKRAPSGIHVKRMKQAARASPALSEDPSYTILKRVASVSMVERVMLEWHNNRAHQGYDTLHEAISMEWVGITRDMCIAWCKRCAICKLKYKTSKPPRLLNAIATDKLFYRSHVQADCMCFLDKRAGFIIIRVILNIVCIATKLHELTLLPNKESETMERAFRRSFIRMGGPPDKLQTDNGSEFINEDVILLMTLLCVLYIHGKPYTPSTQGVVERSNRVLRRMLELMCEMEKYHDWEFEDILLQVQYWMNSAYHRSTKTNAYQLVMGRPPRHMADQEICPLSEEEFSKIDEEEPVTVEEASSAMPSAMAALHADRIAAAGANAGRYQAQWMALRNAGLKGSTFSIGDVVLYRVEKKRSKMTNWTARQLDHQCAVVVDAHAYNKYTVYTRFGLLRDAVYGGDMDLYPVEATRPIGLPIDERSIWDVVQQYTRGEHKPLSKDAFLKACQQLQTQPDSARVEWRVTEGDEDHAMDLRGVVRITRKRVYEKL